MNTILNIHSTSLLELETQLGFIHEETLHFTVMKNLSLDPSVVISCNGTNLSTGTTGRLIKRIEVILER